MARGLPAVVGAVLGLPLIGAGGYAATTAALPSALGAPLAVFGAFLLLVGCYIQFLGAPDPPALQEGEELLAVRQPAQYSAIVTALLGIPLVGAGLYLLFGTRVPYMYPGGVGLLGLYLFSDGVHTYWRNTLTTYYVTSERIVTEYRFLSLKRNEIPFERVRGVGGRREREYELERAGTSAARCSISWSAWGTCSSGAAAAPTWR
jgi:hypothetical protein